MIHGMQLVPILWYARTIAVMQLYRTDGCNFTYHCFQFLWLSFMIDVINPLMTSCVQVAAAPGRGSSSMYSLLPVLPSIVYGSRENLHEASSEVENPIPVTRNSK